MKYKNKIYKVKNSGKRITKLLLLLGIREGYLLTKNIYGITEHPFLTFNRIWEKRDLSQGILIFGLPVGLWFGWLFILLVSRIFIFGRLQFGFLAKASFLGSTLFTSICFLLFAFFFYSVWKKERGDK